ncbi:hypothetical protein [Kribbella sancticallisti]|uniref:hypothetical protein n=1 Tax=Kribbella sancticallisti TaxID=460087 RepID=UPI0031D384BD
MADLQLHQASAEPVAAGGEVRRNGAYGLWVYGLDSIERTVKEEFRSAAASAAVLQRFGLEIDRVVLRSRQRNGRSEFGWGGWASSALGLVGAVGAT